MGQSTSTRKHYNQVDQVCSVDEVPEFMQAPELQPAGNAAAIEAMEPANEPMSLVDAIDLQMQDCMEGGGHFDAKDYSCSNEAPQAAKPAPPPTCEMPAPEPVRPPRPNRYTGPSISANPNSPAREQANRDRGCKMRPVFPRRSLTNHHTQQYQLRQAAAREEYERCLKGN